ncbi:helicase with zinc finger domain 2 [Patella vulgata]|uniref:helicase with zinc finger domain 2 n=1 Tax=Patella vulgata TaxID=6465 RepID=UPI0024A9CF38|nr:helicase with zinc finger domain 2 [Patella vulgata]
MVKNGKTLDDMVNPDVHETYKEPTLQSSGPVLLPADVKLRNYYCEDCSIQFDNLKDINKHTETSDHKFNVEADIVQQWNFRQPPWNKDIKVYQLCSKTDCPYSHVSDQFNYCQDAHGQPELNEWNERYTHRQMKRNMLKDIQFMSYADRVLYKETNGISISCDKDLNVRLTKKKHIWKFTVKINPELPVKRICLLLNRDRHNFNISTSTEHLQFIDGTKLDQSNSNPFTINVHFRSFRDGYFVQWVVFEFGSGPAIVRKLTVETCEEEHNIANEPKCEAEVWTKYTREIITDPSLVEDKFTGKLLTEYKQADEEDRLHAFYNRDFPLNRYNYQHKMHKLLYSEELTRRNIIARYNLVTKVTVKGVIEDETFIFAQSGELFARISLTEDLSEDTDEGRLFLESVQGALIKPKDAPDNRVYEVGIAKRDKFKGIGKNYIYLELHPTTVKQLELKPDTDVEMEIQFQMNRGTFCRMHYSVDRLSDVDIVFPNLSKLNVLNWNEHERDIKRSQNAVETLMEGAVTPLIKEIALGTKQQKKENYRDVDEILSMKICGNALQPQNYVQMQVTKYALSNPFTLIQGPPGTGKTVTGAYLAFYFVTRNKSRSVHGREQVVYCGPSNKSVDVVVDKLLHLGESCPNIIRVYSNRIENMEYPLPRDSVPTKKRYSAEVSKVQAIRDRALHHLIRAPGNSYSEKIRDFDRMFQPSSPDDVDELVDEYIKIKGLNKIFRETLIRSMTDELKEKYKRDVINFKKEELKKKVNDKLIIEYKRKIYMAKTEELNKADIILSTCFAIGGIKTEIPLNIKQIIIDESGMCTEPETMIPLTSFDASNIVLIGDHKQLQPILSEQKAKQLGLQTSLFERYAGQAQMLEIQYRMHEGIMEFPSNMFYDGKLRTGTKRQSKKAELDIWPNGRRHPTVLCHTEGEEDTLTVSTEDGSEQSKRNQNEVDYVVSVAVNLVVKWKLKSQNIAILSQYRAQCSAIKAAMKDCGLPEIHVSTVVASQGSEWEYVIFSTVRSLPIDMLENYPSRSWIRHNLGFITDDHQLNVAITRAKQGLIIIGNKHLLNCDSTWQKLTEHYEERGLVVDAEDYPLCRR